MSDTLLADITEALERDDLTETEIDSLLSGLEAMLAAEYDWTLQPRQQVAEDFLADLNPDQGHELLYGGAVGGGKGLSLETPIATPTGWTTMGALRVGDAIFAGDGSVTFVTFASPVHHRPCYRLVLADGSSLVCDDEHRWQVWTTGDRAARAHRTDAWRAARRAKRPRRGTGAKPWLAERNSARPTLPLEPPLGRTVTTLELVDLLESEPRVIGLRQPDSLELPERELPIDPYLLGCWLGDGSSHSGRFTSADPEIVSAFASRYRVTHYGGYAYGTWGLMVQLRALGVLRNKHVPDLYLRASDEQRLALLQGLMDTDGFAREHGGVEFTGTRPELIEGVLELIRSLGWRCQAKEGRATLEGRDCGPKWRIVFTPDRKVFRLARKLERQGLGGERTRWRYIASLEPTESVPTRCIAVTHSSKTFLAGREMIPTHNSDFLLWHHYHLAQQYPGYRGLIIRRTFRELARTLIRRSFETFDRSLCKWNGVDKMWRFANGSTIELGYCESETDVYQYQSAEYDVISFDELTQWPSDFAYTYLFSRIRTRAHLTAAGLVGHMVSGTNPGNVGGVWVKKRFIDEGAEMRQIELADPTSDLITTRCFVPAKMGDNRHINKRQYRAMLTNLAPALRAQLEDGSWDVVEGMYFPEWERRIHVMSPFEIPANWPRIRGIDYGYTNPMACYWCAFDQDGTAYFYRELYGTGMTPIIQARRILELTPPRENVDYTVADPSIWTKTGVGPPIASQFRAAGLNTRKANNARIDGWARVRDFLRVDETLGRPKMYVFTTCQNLIRTLPMMVHDKTHPEDLDTRSEDHAVDCIRYMLMSRPRTIVTPRREAITLEERIAESHRRKRGFESRMVHPDLGRI